MVGGCGGTRFGCCPGSATVAKTDIAGVNCANPPPAVIPTPIVVTTPVTTPATPATPVTTQVVKTVENDEDTMTDSERLALAKAVAKPVVKPVAKAVAVSRSLLELASSVVRATASLAAGDKVGAAGVVGGCAGTRFGCCAGTAVARLDAAGSNCAKVDSMLMVVKSGAATAEEGRCIAANHAWVRERVIPERSYEESYVSL